MTTTKTGILPGHVYSWVYDQPLSCGWIPALFLYSLMSTHLSTPAQLLPFSGSPPRCPPTSPMELCAPSLVAPGMGPTHTHLWGDLVPVRPPHWLLASGIRGPVWFCSIFYPLGLVHACYTTKTPKISGHAMNGDSRRLLITQTPLQWPSLSCTSGLCFSSYWGSI